MSRPDSQVILFRDAETPLTMVLLHEQEWANFEAAGERDPTSVYNKTSVQRQDEASTTTTTTSSDSLLVIRQE